MPGKPLAIAVAASLAVGCVPQTSYRNTGLIPAAHALDWDGRTVPKGSIRVEGTMLGTTIGENLAPQVHDTALFVPGLTLEGAATIAIAQGCELGVRVAYSQYSWSNASALGTMPLVGEPGLWGVGPEVRMTIPLNPQKQWAIGIAGNLMNYQIPYAEWQAASCSGGETCFEGYSLVEQQTSAHLVLNAGIYPSFQLGPEGRYGHVFGALSAHAAFKNDGFTDTPASNQVEDAGFIFVPAVGYGIHFDELLLSTKVEWPITTSASPIVYGPGVSLTVGIAFRSEGAVARGASGRAMTGAEVQIRVSPWGWAAGGTGAAEGFFAVTKEQPLSCFDEPRIRLGQPDAPPSESRLRVVEIEQGLADAAGCRGVRRSAPAFPGEGRLPFDEPRIEPCDERAGFLVARRFAATTLDGVSDDVHLVTYANDAPLHGGQAVGRELLDVRHATVRPVRNGRRPRRKAVLVAVAHDGLELRDGADGGIARALRGPAWARREPREEHEHERCSPLHPVTPARAIVRPKAVPGRPHRLLAHGGARMRDVLSEAVVRRVWARLVHRRLQRRVPQRLPPVCRSAPARLSERSAGLRSRKATARRRWRPLAHRPLRL